MWGSDRIIRLAQGILPVEKVYGTQFLNMYNFINKSQWWSKEKLEEYQFKKLKFTIINAYENVPYYNELFNEYSINPYAIQNFGDIKRIPYLTKDIIRNNLGDLVNKKYKKYRIGYKSTGGSTGIPMGLYQDRFTTRKLERAFVAQQWGRVGYDINRINKVVFLRGMPIKGIKERNGYHLILNSYMMTDDNMIDFVKSIEQFNPDYINGYPSVIYLLSKHLIDNNISFNCNNLKAILCSSENLYDFQREAITRAFNKRVYSFYGHTERACIAGECEHSTNYHIQSEYGYTELINSEGNQAAKENELCEIVCSGFINPVMPFIRYKTQDVAVNTLEKCKCGRNYKLIKKIEGRKQDFFVDKKGSLITFTCADDALWDVKDKLYAYQYIQNEKGKVILNIHCKIQLTDNHINKIKRDFNKFYKTIEIDVNQVEYIERTKNGKFKYIIQNIHIDF